MFGKTNARKYWKHCTERCSWFQGHPSSSYARKSHLVPLSLYGDEVQSFKNTEAGIVEILAWSSDFTAGHAPLERYMPILCISEHHVHEKTWGDVWSALIPRLRRMCSEDTFPWSSSGYRFMISSLQGGLKWLNQKFEINAFNSNELCSRCRCCKNHADAGMTVGDMRVDATHRSTMVSHAEFLQEIPAEDRHPIWSLPGLTVHRCLHDVCHGQMLGTGKVLNGSILVYLAEAGHFGDFPQQGQYDVNLDMLLRRAFGKFCAYKKSHKLAVASKILSFWLAEEVSSWALRPSATEVDKRVATVMYTYVELFKLMDQCGAIFGEAEAQEFHEKGLLHLQEMDWHAAQLYLLEYQLRQIAADMCSLNQIYHDLRHRLHMLELRIDRLLHPRGHNKLAPELQIVVFDELDE
ncbi:unnamed protein product [Symbiodinium sp. CCMP2592]|nr:unnamed protein product [Symbiodinium sp. CCMP2592]